MDMATKQDHLRAGDVILWCNDLVHCQASWTVLSRNCRILGRSVTCVASRVMTTLDVVARKLEEWLTMQTNDHWLNVQSLHFAPPRKKKKKIRQQKQQYYDSKAAASENDDEADNIKMMWGSITDGLPMLTLVRQNCMFWFPMIGVWR